MTEEVATTKVEEAFGKAWESVGDEVTTGMPLIDVCRLAFAAGARAFSTMPLCEHGVAIWGVEFCNPCAAAGPAPAFPGYNRPFEAELPEGMTAGDLEDLKVEHEAMRRSLLQVLVKVGVLDQDGVNAPWDGVNTVHFVGLWLANALPFIRMPRVLTAAVGDLERRLASVEEQLQRVWAGEIPEKPEEGAGLSGYARRELELSGLCSGDSQIPGRVMELIEAFRAAGHSGGSAGATLAILGGIGWEEARTTEKQHDGPVQDVVNVFSKQVYEGDDARTAFEIFLHLASWKPLGAGGSTDLSDFVPAVNEANDVSEYCDMAGSTQTIYQSTRKSSVFSADSGATWYDIDRPDWAHPAGCTPTPMPSGK
jgi:hypothetical protein